MTIDEELTLLDSNLRRLKIEYEIFFNNPTKRPPTDIEWKVLNLLRKTNVEDATARPIEPSLEDVFVTLTRRLAKK